MRAGRVGRVRRLPRRGRYVSTRGSLASTKRRCVRQRLRHFTRYRPLSASAVFLFRSSARGSEARAIERYCVFTSNVITYSGSSILVPALGPPSRATESTHHRTVRLVGRLAATWAAYATSRPIASHGATDGGLRAELPVRRVMGPPLRRVMGPERRSEQPKLRVPRIGRRVHGSEIVFLKRRLERVSQGHGATRPTATSAVAPGGIVSTASSGAGPGMKFRLHGR